MKITLPKAKAKVTSRKAPGPSISTGGRVMKDAHAVTHKAGKNAVPNFKTPETDQHRKASALLRELRSRGKALSANADRLLRRVS